MMRPGARPCNSGHAGPSALSFATLQPKSDMVHLAERLQLPAEALLQASQASASASASGDSQPQPRSASVARRLAGLSAGGSLPTSPWPTVGVNVGRVPAVGFWCPDPKPARKRRVSLGPDEDFTDTPPVPCKRGASRREDSSHGSRKRTKEQRQNAEWLGEGDGQRRQHQQDRRVERMRRRQEGRGEPGHEEQQEGREEPGHEEQQSHRGRSPPASPMRMLRQCELDAATGSLIDDWREAWPEDQPEVALMSLIDDVELTLDWGRDSQPARQSSLGSYEPWPPQSLEQCPQSATPSHVTGIRPTGGLRRSDGVRLSSNLAHGESLAHGAGARGSAWCALAVKPATATAEVCSDMRYSESVE